jgi:hypothetical protein
MSTNCVLTNTRYGPAELQLPFGETDCVRNFTCQDFETMMYFDVTCPGTMKIYTYKQDVTYDWSCTMYSDGCVYTYSYSETITNTWTENGNCAMPGGRSCCPPDSMVING